MDIHELKDLISSQLFTLNKAKTRGMMVSREMERMQNVLMTHKEDIVNALEYAENAAKTIERLSIEVENSDAELQDKDDEIAALKEKLNGKKGAGKRAEAPAVDESVE